jgi:hypothetical protein
VFILILEAGFAKINKQLGNGILGYTSHADGRPNTIAFDKALNHLNSLRIV